MSPKHAPWRAHILFHDVAEQQIADCTDEERARLDRAIDNVAANPNVADPIKGKLEREYRAYGTRVIYIPTVLGTIILITYVEA